MEKHPFNPISVSCCCLELLDDGGEAFGTASGFLWRNGTRVFLITNWHVVSALHAFSGQHMLNGRVPKALRVRYVVEYAPLKPSDNNLLSVQCSLSLYDDAKFHQPFWFEHPSRPASRADVVALEMPDPFPGCKIHCVNDVASDDLVEMVGVDVFPVGYPLGVQKNPLPIWKRGSIATEPQINWSDRPAFLIDCRTSSGMSGAPVLRQVFGPAALTSGVVHADRVRSIEFLGVYSGRLSDDDNVASIGIVWRKDVITELLADPAPGRRDG